MKATAVSASQLSDGLFLTRLSRAALKAFAEDRLYDASDRCSIVLADAGSFDPKTGTLTFDGDTATLLCVGRDETCLIVLDRVVSPSIGSSLRTVERPFLAALEAMPSIVHNLGLELLKAVRAKRPGRLESGAPLCFTEAEDQSWSLKLNPRDRSITVSIAGSADRYRDTTSPDLAVRRVRRHDLEFKIRSMDQVAEAARVIVAASAVSTRPSRA